MSVTCTSRTDELEIDNCNENCTSAKIKKIEVCEKLKDFYAPITCRMSGRCSLLQEISCEFKRSNLFTPRPQPLTFQKILE